MPRRGRAVPRQAGRGAAAGMPGGNAAAPPSLPLSLRVPERCAEPRGAAEGAGPSRQGKEGAGCRSGDWCAAREVN